MSSNPGKPSPFGKTFPRSSFQSNGSDKKIVDQFRHQAQNDSRISLHPLQDNHNPSLKSKRRLEPDDISKLSLAQLNAELESNNSQMTGLINKRKSLIHHRKQRLREEYQLRGATLNQNQELKKIASFVGNPDKGRRVLMELIHNIPVIQNRKMDQQNKSREFWVLNKKYQNEIDVMLNKLKQVDFNLERQTAQVANICKALDNIEDTLKEVVHRKSQDQMKRAQPLFISKKKTEEILAVKVAQKERIKDQKIQYIKSIRGSLTQLKEIRDNRVDELYHLFGIQQGPDPDSSMSFLMECTESFEELVRMKDRSAVLDVQQREASQEFESLLRGEEVLYNQLMKRQSDEAKAFQGYYNLVLQKAKFNSIFSLFGKQLDSIDKYNLGTSDVIHRHKMYKELLKTLTDEDKMLKQALVRTNQTYRTFTNILKSTESEKERRRELLNILQSCAKLKHEQEDKKDNLRNLTIETTKMHQKKEQIEDQLENIMTDGNLESYKRIGQAMTRCQSEIDRLDYQRKNQENEIDNIDREIVGVAETFKNDYADIIKDILPGDFEFSFKSSDDVKQIKNYIRKTYRRMGLEQQN